LVGSSLEQPAFARAARESAKINHWYPEPMLVLLDAAAVMQIGDVVLVMDIGRFQGRRQLRSQLRANELPCGS
jgi:hypothetical protein